MVKDGLGAAAPISPVGSPSVTATMSRSYWSTARTTENKLALSRSTSGARIAQGGGDRLGQGVGVANRHEPAKAAASENLGGAARTVGADHRTTAGHGFRQDVADPS
jgi:hypothetical protein